MNKTIYLIRHSSPFVQIENYDNYKDVLWEEYNKNMILSSEGEEKSKKLCNITELKNIKIIYSSNSFRAIGTAKYLAEQNNVKIRLDNRIDERIFGIKYLNELPDNFTKQSFDNKDYKLNDGESLNDVDYRFNSFIEEILNGGNDSIVVVIHGILLLSFLTTICEYTYDGKSFNVKYNGKTIINDSPKSPGIYKITFNEHKQIIDIDVINEK